MINIITALILSTGVGDKASYVSKKNCTSRSIKSLNIKTEIVGDTKEKFRVKVDYRIKSHLGSKSGESFRSLDKYYFEPQFWDYLEAVNVHEGNGFSLKHNGREGDCHKVHVFNIKDSKGAKADALICSGYPVLGAKTILIHGKYLGSRYKACLEIK